MRRSCWSSCKFKIPSLLLTLSSVESTSVNVDLDKKSEALLMQLHYQHNSNAPVTRGEYRRVKGLRKGPLSTSSLRNTVNEKSRHYSHRPPKSKKPHCDSTVPFEDDQQANNVNDEKKSIYNPCIPHFRRIRNEAVLERVGEDRIMLKLIRKKKRNWLGHCLLKDPLEEMVNERKVRGRRRYQTIDNIKIYGSYAETKGPHTRKHLSGGKSVQTISGR
ncbi:hypothetical protein ANN_21704 [Periplaneta americana]|uniref:Uncharacterized protein n=1 Tax=Periplaneta americana TaxID=6978 RepID=A0ABQ8S6I3_PERAM|nr:hypothetical protein ANN_21704 [Periplaneta americana]